MKKVHNPPMGGVASVAPLLTKGEYIARLLSVPRPGEDNILAFYEHRLGGICREPRLMLLPLDDHLAHRGDGIFETIQYAGGRLYRLDDHLARMRRSAKGIFISPPCSWEHIRALVLAVAAAGRKSDGMMRILIGRGPGGFSINPAECPQASLYIVAYHSPRRPESWYEKGLKGFRTSIPAKQGYLARIKNANYLPNVLMTHEANQLGKDVPFCFNQEGFLAESAVANICLIGRDGVLEVPEGSNSLPGTTVLRAIDLLAGEPEHRICKITESDILAANEVLILGTGIGCAAVVDYEGHNIGTGKEGQVVKRLRALIRADILATGVPVPEIVVG